MKTKNLQIGLSIFLLVGLFAYFYMFTGVFGDTKIGVTIRTNPNLEDGLVGHWTFDGDLESQITDHSGTQNTAYMSAGGDATSTMVSAGNTGQGFEFDGTDDSVEIPHDTSIDFINRDFTVATWVKFDSVSGTQTFVNKGDSTGATMYELWLEFGYLWFRTSDGGSATHDADSADIRAGEWYHVVGVHDNTNSRVYIYINGEQVLDESETGNDAPASDWPLFLGSREDSSRYFDGTLDDVRIYDRVLDNDEVLRLYQLGATSHVQTVDTNPSQNGLVGHWTLDNRDYDSSSTTAEILDRSDNNNHGDLNGLSINNGGKIGEYGEFDGLNDHIAIPETDSLNEIKTNDAVTVATWVKYRYNVASSRMILSKTDDWREEYALYMENMDGENADICYAGANFGIIRCPSGGVDKLLHDNWHHVAMTYSMADGVAYLYVDGEVVDEFAESNAMSSQTGDFCIGGNTSVCTNQDFEGDLDDIYLYSRALSPDEIKLLYNKGARKLEINTTVTSNPEFRDGLLGHYSFDGDGFDWDILGAECRDVSGNGRHLDSFVNSDYLSVKPGRIGQAFDFDTGTDQCVQQTAADTYYLNDTLTVTAWIKPRTQGEGDFGIIATTGGTNGGWYFSLCSSNGSECPGADRTFQWYQQAANPASWHTNDETIPLNEWTHVAATYDRTTYAGSAPLLYINGVSVNVNEADGPGGSVSEGGTDLVIGNFNGTDDFDGLIDDVRIYDRILSADEIMRLYQLGD